MHASLHEAIVDSQQGKTGRKSTSVAAPFEGEPMYCIHCGSKLSDDARFCTNCGSAVEKGKDSVPDGTSIVQDSRNSTGQGDSTSSDRGKASASQPVPNYENHTSMKSAVGSAKHRSISAVRMIALVALAVTLAAGAAYAAYRVYADVWLPSQQAQEQVQETETPEQTAEEESNSEYDAAMEAYQNVLDEYQEFAAKSGNQETIQDVWMNEYPDLSWEVIRGGSVRYCYKDLNTDGIPELLIGPNNSGYEGVSDEASSAIYDLVSYTGRGPVHLYYGTPRGFAFLCEDDVIGFYGTGGATTGAYEYKKLGASLADVSTINAPGADADSNFNVLESISWNGTPSSLAVSIAHADGSSESKTVSHDGLTPLIDAIKANHPADTSAEWRPLQ